ncbi:MAG: MYXO-CTERM sorting domain-containing protein [Nannocystaceae bacterium]
MLRLKNFGPVAIAAVGILMTPAGAGAANPASLDSIDWLERPAVSEPESLLERTMGVDVAPEDMPEPFWDGTNLHDAESLTTSSLKAMGLEPRALDFDATPGILYLAMQGITIKKVCSGGSPGQNANSALDCSPLVDGQTTFPVYGNDQSQATMFQKLAGYYNDFNLVMTTGRPPEWVPYTMAVIGGAAGLAGQPNGVCGVANVACDGAKRNHVSLTFPQSCGGSVAEIAAQETAHNWGLEHTDIMSDIMYPYVTGGNNSFRNECMGISHATGNGITQCPQVHEFYCPGGEGEEQNSYAELMGIFGPRAADNVAPTITNLLPSNGSTWTTSDAFTITASFNEDSNFLAVKWDWLEGRPESLADGYSRCTNKVCEDDYPAWRDNADPYDFIAFDQPPAGTYKMKVEAMDAYGNYVTETITFTVVEGDEPSTTGMPGETDTTGSDSDTESGTETGTETETAGPTTGGGMTTGSETGSDPTIDPSVGGTETATDTSSEMDEGCGCMTSGAPPMSAGLLLLLAALGVPRRRREHGA